MDSDTISAVLSIAVDLFGTSNCGGQLAVRHGSDACALTRLHG